MTGDIHSECARFCNNPCLVHECAVRCMAKYPVSTSTYTDLPGGNIWLSTRVIVYITDKEKDIECYIDAEFTGGWAQGDANNT